MRRAQNVPRCLPLISLNVTSRFACVDVCWRPLTKLERTFGGGGRYGV